MKKLLILISAFTISLGVFAQEHGMGGMENKEKKMGKMEHGMNMNIDHVMMNDGKMEMVKKGKTMPMDKKMTMGNGTEVMTDGMCKMKDGKTMMMKNGDMMDMNGKMSKMPKKKMGKMQM